MCTCISLSINFHNTSEAIYRWHSRLFFAGWTRTRVRRDLFSRKSVCRSSLRTVLNFSGCFRASNFQLHSFLAFVHGNQVGGFDGFFGIHTIRYQNCNVTGPILRSSKYKGLQNLGIKL